MYGEPFLIYMYENSIESNIHYENIHSHSMENILKITGTKFEIKSLDKDWGLHIHIVNCVRGIIIKNCTFQERHKYLNKMFINLGDDSSCNRTIAATLSIEGCYFFHYSISFRIIPKFSYFFAQMNNIVFFESLVIKATNGGLVAFTVQNCSFVGSKKSRPRALHLMDVLYVSIKYCKFRTHNLYCWQGCAVSVKGVYPFPFKILYMFSKASPFTILNPILIVNHSQFVGSTADLSGGVMSCVEAALKVSNSIFHMTANSKPPATGGFIYHQTLYSLLISFLDNVIFDTKSYRHPVSLVSFRTPYEIKSSTLFCSQSLQPKLVLTDITIDISCEAKCPKAYTFQNGNMSIDLIQHEIYGILRNASLLSNSNVSIEISEVECFTCPIGAV